MAKILSRNYIEKTLIKFDENGKITFEPNPLYKPKRKKNTKVTNELNANIVKYIRDLGGFAIRISTTGRPIPAGGGLFKLIKNVEMKGFPDVLCCYKSLFVGIETKTAKESLSPEQKEKHIEIRQAGGVVFVARDFETFKKEFEQWK